MNKIKPDPNVGNRLFCIYILWYLIGSLSTFVLIGILEGILAK